MHSYGAVADDLKAKIQDAQTQRDALLKEQQQLQVQLDTLNSQKQTLSGAVKTLTITKTKLANDIKLTLSKIKGADLNIQALETTMNQKENEIAIHQKAIASTLQQLSDYDSHSMITDMLTYNKVSDAWADQGALQDLQNKLGEQINELRLAQDVLDKEKTLKEQNKQALVSLNSQLGGQKKVVENNQANKTKLLAETKSQEAAYQQLLADNKAREKKFEDALFLYESQLQVELDPNKIPLAAHSVLAWPLTKFKITQLFGKTSSSGRLYASGTHNGMDFGVSVGAPVMAVRGGVISGTGNTDLSPGCYSYGRWILIKHDNGLSTVYGHLSGSLVQTGQTVTTGEVIGYSGGMPGGNGAGYSTGPHLHLGLYATQAVKIQQYSSSINCKNTSIPIAPPDGYLDPLVYLPAL